MAAEEAYELLEVEGSEGVEQADGSSNTPGQQYKGEGGAAGQDLQGSTEEAGETMEQPSYLDDENFQQAGNTTREAAPDDEQPNERDGELQPISSVPDDRAKMAGAAEASTSYKYEEANVEDYVVSGYKAITVNVDQGPGLPHRMVRVLIDVTQQDRKPYVGGFHNKHSGHVYHHALTQTPRQPKYTLADRKHSHETQTVRLKTRTQQTFREAGTQMDRPGLLLNTAEDRAISPRPYQTADEVLAIRLAAIIVIQRCTRGWFARSRARHLRRMKAERDAFLQEQELRNQVEAEEHRKHEIERRLHPRQAQDFEVLYNELEAWRLQETRRIKESGMSADDMATALQQLLHKETKLLQTIDRLKITANQQNKEARVQRTLRDMSQPKKWDLRNGNKALVHTPFTTRAKELMQLYNGLNLLGLTVDERLDVLLHVKWTVKEFDCNLTRELVELIDREADLLNRGRSPKTLEGLRKRISSLFLSFIETPEFNPEAQVYQIGADSRQEDYNYQTLAPSSARPEPIKIG